MGNVFKKRGFCRHVSLDLGPLRYRQCPQRVYKDMLCEYHYRVEEIKKFNIMERVIEECDDPEKMYDK
jgi:hypothetical protein